MLMMVWLQESHLCKSVGHNEPLSDSHSLPGCQGFKEHLFFHLKNNDNKKDENPTAVGFKKAPYFFYNTVLSYKEE